MTWRHVVHPHLRKLRAMKGQYNLVAIRVRGIYTRARKARSHPKLDHSDPVGFHTRQHLRSEVVRAFMWESVGKVISYVVDVAEPVAYGSDEEGRVVEMAKASVSFLFWSANRPLELDGVRTRSAGAHALPRNRRMRETANL